MEVGDTLALIEDIVNSYNTPQYNSIEEYFESELTLLSMQIENLKRKVEFLRTGEFKNGKEKEKDKHSKTHSCRIKDIHSVFI